MNYMNIDMTILIWFTIIQQSSSYLLYAHIFSYIHIYENRFLKIHGPYLSHFCCSNFFIYSWKIYNLYVCIKSYGYFHDVCCINESIYFSVIWVFYDVWTNRVPLKVFNAVISEFGRLEHVIVWQYKEKESILQYLFSPE